MLTSRSGKAARASRMPATDPAAGLDPLGGGEVCSQEYQGQSVPMVRVQKSSRMGEQRLEIPSYAGGREPFYALVP
jgi:hypothetical protein